MKRRIFLGCSLAALATACRAAPTMQPPPTPVATVSRPTATIAAVRPAQQTATAATPNPAHDVLYIRDDHGVAGPGQIAVVDTATDQRSRSLPIGLVARDWSALYTATWEGGKTTLRAVDPATGEVVHQSTLDDVYTLAGLSPDGRWLALSWEPSRGEVKAFEKDGKWKSRFLILDRSLGSRAAPRGAPIALDGDFWFDAIDGEGTSLFLIESLFPGAGGVDPRYQVRLYDLNRRRLQPGAVVDKTGAEVMGGVRQSSVFSPDGTWLYSLYRNQTKGPFVHALNLAQRFAVCIDLPATGMDDYEKQLLWSTALAPDGKTLYAANGALGLVASVDLAQLQVGRTGRFPVASAATPGPLSRLGSGSRRSPRRNVC